MDTLFDTLLFYGRPVDRVSKARIGIGEVAEEFACRALGMTRQRIDGRKKVCCDALHQGEPTEIKSIRSTTSVLYKFRLEKEQEAFGLDYRYVFVKHNCSGHIKNTGEVLQSFLTKPPVIWVTDLRSVRASIGDKPAKKFSLSEKLTAGRPAGFTRGGYADGGWYFKLRSLDVATEQCCLVKWLDTEIPVGIKYAYRNNQQEGDPF